MNVSDPESDACRMLIDENGVLYIEMNTAFSEEKNPKQVSFKENSSGGGYVNLSPSKSEKGVASTVISGVASLTMKKDKKGVKRKRKEGEDGESDKARKRKVLKEIVKSDGLIKSSEIDSSLHETSDLKFLIYPDPDFNNFDKDRKAELFAAGQVWAAYDFYNVMPRFYAHIKSVSSPGFNVHITWLEPVPTDENELKWHVADLPFSCGEFSYGDSEKTTNRFMFSHQVSWEKGSSRGTFLIHPRKGEIWALFKNWDIKWSGDPAAHSKSEYEYVEILSDYAEGVGINVALLNKVNKFVSVFCRVKKKIFRVPPGELLRFSHMIPSYKMESNERGVPDGSFELDPAALPVIKTTARGVNDMQRSRPSETQQDSSAIPLAPRPENLQLPDSEFYNFDADKSKNKFRPGQIWALYSDEDSMPKYYAKIRKIDLFPSFKLHISWLVSDEYVPLSCGRFTIRKGEGPAYDCLNYFSHQVNAELTGRRNEYGIFPRKGEIWALYRNWKPNRNSSDLENCEYDIVEVLSATVLLIKVSVLERVNGFISVYKARLQGGSTLIWRIPQVDFFKFSHQIPAFRLTEERGGKLRGFFELDSGALPAGYFG